MQRAGAKERKTRSVGACAVTDDADEPAVSTQAEERRMRRIFAQGFTAAERLTEAQRRTGETDGFAALNPYAVEPERTRWTEGFTRARSNNGRAPAKAKPFGRKGND